MHTDPTIPMGILTWKVTVLSILLCHLVLIKRALWVKPWMLRRLVNWVEISVGGPSPQPLGSDVQYRRESWVNEDGCGRNGLWLYNLR